MRLYRALVGHPDFRNDAEAMAFAWLVAKASWQPVEVRYKGKRASLQRGQVAISVRDFARAMDRHQGWVERLLGRLKSSGMIKTDKGTASLVITICNYDAFQRPGEQDKTANGTAKKTEARQARDTEQGREIREEGIGEPNGSLPLIGGTQPIERPVLLPEHVLDFWNTKAVGAGLKKARMTPQRKPKIMARIKEHPAEDWAEMFDALVRSPFLLGESESGWKANFDFILKPGNFTKIQEGTYVR